MKISFGSRFDDVDPTNGYGYATKCILESLERLGYQVGINDASADVEIWFDQPQHWNFSKGPYRIGYHPWESTLLQAGWSDIMNECDEIWTPSPLIASWYRAHAGVRVPVHVYEHGIDHAWEPRERGTRKNLRFLHVGTEATRKGGWDLVPAFRKAFPDREHTLTLKMIKSDWNGISSLGGIHYLKEKMTFAQLQDLYYSHDVYVYPSWGEGFGLTPLQAMATGMPTITLPGWAPYSRFIDPDLALGHELVDSPWPDIHPGQMMKPDMDEVVEKMRYVADNYESAHLYAQLNSPAIHCDYDWDRITSRVFRGLESRLK